MVGCGWCREVGTPQMLHSYDTNKSTHEESLTLMYINLLKENIGDDPNHPRHTCGTSSLEHGLGTSRSLRNRFAPEHHSKHHGCEHLLLFQHLDEECMFHRTTIVLEISMCVVLCIEWLSLCNVVFVLCVLYLLWV